jgi:glycerol kinase
MRPLQTETTAFGVALLGGIQLGWYADLDALPALVRAESWFYPQLSSGQRAELLTGWQRAVAQLLATETR